MIFINGFTLQTFQGRAAYVAKKTRTDMPIVALYPQGYQLQPRQHPVKYGIVF
jgi:hypothetical protein